MALYAAVNHCRLCRGELDSVIDLGLQPPANSLRSDIAARLPMVPLVLMRCVVCGTVQLGHTVDPTFLFREYVWVTGTSAGANRHSERFFEVAIGRARAGKLAVLEVASNDGTFLRPFRAAGHDVLGIDPAVNLARAATDSGIPTRAEFFGLECARRVVHASGPFDMVVARNVLPHVPDLPDVVAGIAHCVSDDGTVLVEFHRADVILEGLHYDSIYHEHVYYHSLHGLRPLFQRHGLHLFDVVDSPISGGSFIACFSPEGRPNSVAMAEALAREKQVGVDTCESWSSFAHRCNVHKKELIRTIETVRMETPGRMVGYGASARSATLLNYCGIGRRELDCIADANTLKQGQFAPGSDLRIDGPSGVFSAPVGSVLLLAWNFHDEIVERLRSDLMFRGPVIVPLPHSPSVLRK